MPHHARPRVRQQLPAKVGDQHLVAGIVGDEVAAARFVDVELGRIEGKHLLRGKAPQVDGDSFAGPCRPRAAHELGRIRIGDEDSPVGVALEIRRPRRCAYRCKVHRGAPNAVGTELVDLAVTQEKETAVRDGGGATRPDRGVHAHARVDDERDAGRERRERDQRDEVTVDVDPLPGPLPKGEGEV